MGKQFIVERPWQRIYTDSLGPYPRSKAGNTHILIVLILMKLLSAAKASSIISFLESSVFRMFGVPEFLFCDNGSQYNSKIFAKFLKAYGVTHTRTALHSQQANASERVNRSILSAIRAEIDTDQRDWDSQICAISAALRNSVHDSTGFSPFFLVFSQHMVQNGATYELLRLLGSLPGGDIEVLLSTDFRQVIHERVKENLSHAHQRRTSIQHEKPRGEIFRRVFAQSKFSKNFHVKLGKQRVKARILRKKWNCMYDLEDPHGNPIALPYHAKDLKQAIRKKKYTVRAIVCLRWPIRQAKIPLLYKKRKTL